MSAKLILRRRVVMAENAFAELTLWRLSAPLIGSSHPFKYRLALVVDEVCVMRYDNERGKGDHRHIGGDEQTYHFIDMDTLLTDFLADTRRLL